MDSELVKHFTSYGLLSDKKVTEWDCQLLDMIAGAWAVDLDIGETIDRV